jgi:hypothetical protein
MMTIRNTFKNFVLIGALLPVSLMARQYEGAISKKKEIQNKIAGCEPATAIARLDFNNVNARIENGGTLWLNRANGTADYEVPKGGGVSSIYAGSLWLGGESPNGQLKLAATTFRNDGDDFWPGPLTNDGAATATASSCNLYDKFFVAFKADAQVHKAYYDAEAFDRKNGTNTVEVQFPNGYSMPEYFSEWPGNSANSGYDNILAPFQESSDGVEGTYEPDLGDYPGYDLKGNIQCREATRDVPLFGDTTIYWIFNDKGNIHTETAGSEPIGMEIRGQAFAFADEGPVNDMTFYNYVLINQGSQILNNTYFGQWLDVDLGNPTDDFVGCDVKRGLGFAYNGDNDDEVNGGPAPGYGFNPPALGVDFFQGPFQDRDGKDNAGPYHPDFAPAGIKDITANQAKFDQGIPYRGIGIGYGDSIPDNERFGMRKFVYHNIGGQGDPNTQDPKTSTDYYNYLQGIWKNGNPFIYGGNAFSGNGTDPNMFADFMFPGDSDPLGFGVRDANDTPIQNAGTWTETDAGNAKGDRRFLQSAGPFTLTPGDVNNITVGVVWARAEAGGPLASLAKLKEADDIAQGLFDNCFQIFEGPDAPLISSTELENEVILSLYNPGTSNNVNESYRKVKPGIPDSTTIITQATVDFVNGDTIITAGRTDVIINDKSYVFEGYKVYQVKNPTVGPNDLDDLNLARLVFQCDVKNFELDANGDPVPDRPISNLVNYSIDQVNNIAVPEVQVIGSNNGIKKAFSVKEDLFSTSTDTRLVNNKPYYFMAIAYGYNNYEDYNPNTLTGQAEPYVASRKNGVGGSISAITVIPRKTDNLFGGTIINSSFGDELPITRLEGIGNDNKFVKITQETEDAIMSGAPWYTDELHYEKGAGPISIKIVDPLKVKNGDFRIKFFGDFKTSEATLDDEVNWEITDLGTGNTYLSERAIDFGSEQLIPELGISVGVSNVDVTSFGTTFNFGSTEFVGASMEFENESIAWLTGLQDQDGGGILNWIRSGNNFQNAEGNIDFPDYQPAPDTKEQWESALSGSWSPTIYVDDSLAGIFNNNLIEYRSKNNREMRVSYTPNVDLVLTSDRSKWTRSAVLEMAFDPALAVGGAERGELRKSPSRDKFFRQVGDEGYNSDEATLGGTQPEGMSWFPGYAIDVITGERLNIAFTEDSYLKSQNGDDMIWNPTSRITTNNVNGPHSYLFGGKHIILIFKNQVRTSERHAIKKKPSGGDTTPEYEGAKVDVNSYVGMYDSCKTFYENMNSTNGTRKKKTIASIGWVGYPMLSDGFDLLSVEEGLIPTKTKIQLRVSKRFEPYVTGNDYSEQLSDNASVTSKENAYAPLYEFTSIGLAAEKGQTSVVKENLDKIRVVPNPYYAYSEYENGRLDNRVKFTNLPQDVTLSIYTIEGTMVRTFTKSNDNPIIEWDLKNDANIPISSGIYYIHVDVPGVGSHIIKWMGVMRKVDLQNL